MVGQQIWTTKWLDDDDVNNQLLGTGQRCLDGSGWPMAPWKSMAGWLDVMADDGPAVCNQISSGSMVGMDNTELVFHGWNPIVVLGLVMALYNGQMANIAKMQMVPWMFNGWTSMDGLGLVMENGLVYQLLFLSLVGMMLHMVPWLPLLTDGLNGLNGHQDNHGPSMVTC